MKPPQNNCQLVCADVVWSDDGLPSSALYGDIYFSHAAGLEGGFAEKRAVFIEGTQLPSRFSAGSTTSVLELGFGTGLSFLSTWAAFIDATPNSNGSGEPAPVLHFYSIEKHPWRREDFLRLAAAWPTLFPLAEALSAQWPDAVPGFHRRYLAGGQVVLTLIYADVEWALKQLHGPFDAFYLDGFSPSKNSVMWSDGVFRALARVGAPSARLATYSSARHVTSGLMAAGFEVEKVPGFGLKKHQLVAQLRYATRSRRPPPYHYPNSVVVIGAGVAGMTTARALMRRNILVQIFDRAPGLGAGASGNPAGIVSPLLSRDCNATTRLTQMGLGFMRADITQMQCAGHIIAANFSGAIQLARDPDHATRQAQIAQELNLAVSFARWCAPNELSVLAGVTLTEPGWWFPRAGWLTPVDWLTALQQVARIPIQHNTEVARLYREGGSWIGESTDGTRLFTSEQVVLANAENVGELLPEIAPFLTVCRGQMSWHMPMPMTLGSTQPMLRVPLMREGYVLDLPHGVNGGVYAGARVFGASFKPGDLGLDIRESEQGENAERVAAIAPDLAMSSVAIHESSARVALRAASRDRLPMVGALTADPRVEGLWLNVGHGARGLTWGALLGEALAAELCGEPNVLPLSLGKALSPMRFFTG
ncbi:MAG: FAD-dependent 5-carboxymethylaminomethyl-2-thiouridine(34) oxidoreductase MnmC [Halothiobacillus sp.]